MSFIAVEMLQTITILSLNPYFFKKKKKLIFYEIMAPSRFFFSTLAFSLNNCMMFSFLWLVEAKIEILKARTQGKRGVFFCRKICTNLILFCHFYSPLPKVHFSEIMLYINPFTIPVLEVRMFQPDK